MKQTLIMDIAKDAKRDGLTLPACLIHLTEKIERNQQRLEQSSRRDTRAGASSGKRGTGSGHRCRLASVSGGC